MKKLSEMMRPAFPSSQYENWPDKVAALENQLDRAMALLRDPMQISHYCHAAADDFSSPISMCDETPEDRPCWEHRRRALLAEMGLELDSHADIRIRPAR